MSVSSHYLRLQKTSLIYLLLTLTLFLNFVHADTTLSLFPLDKYNQQVSTWLDPLDPLYDQPLMQSATQESHFEHFKKHYMGAESPWDRDYVNKVLKKTSPDDLASIQKDLITTFSNENKPDKERGYGENFSPHTLEWIEDIAANMQIEQFQNKSFQAENRAITIKNLSARILPTYDPHFYHHQLAGQGYPFDNLQISSVWIGTPVYILGQTRDQAFSLVLTPDFIGWIDSDGVAKTNPHFVSTWRESADRNLIAITNKTTLSENHNFLSQAYVGTVLPGEKHIDHLSVMVPVADQNNQATIKRVKVNENHATVMPILLTRHHFAMIIKTLVGRPYGWGNLYFYNDCSAELKSLFTPFGIWLPRHSSDQVSVGKMVDKSALNANERLAYLAANGKPLLTIIYVGGHVFLYLGSYQDPNLGDEKILMSYQNIWGLKPNPPLRRAVIGKAVFLPLLLSYPEDPSLAPQASAKIFQISFLDEIADDQEEHADIRHLTNQP